MTDDLQRRQSSPDLHPNPVPNLGQHTRPILQELGYNADEIDKLVEEGVIGVRIRHNKHYSPIVALREQKISPERP